jgi:hypothetical protein
MYLQKAREVIELLKARLSPAFNTQPTYFQHKKATALICIRTYMVK